MVHTYRYACITSLTFVNLPFLIPSTRIVTTPISAFHILRLPMLGAPYGPVYAMNKNNVYCGCTKALSTSGELSSKSQSQQAPLLNGATMQGNTNKDSTSGVSVPGVSLLSSAIVAVEPSRATAVPSNTFYRRSLPDTCIAFSSALGRKYFESAMRHRGLKSYFHLMEQYTTQSEPAYCGISTLVIALNALAVDPRQIWKGSWRWYEESMLNCCIDLEQAKETGITMATFNCLALCQGLTTDVHYVDENESTSSLENFRKRVMEACVESTDSTESDCENHPHHQEISVDRVLIVSYNRSVLKQTGSGHFSPIAAYDQESDSVLIMDTARFKYGAHWVKVPLLYEAMKPIDKDTGRSRGFIMLVHRKEDDIVAASNHRLPNLPMAMILRSEMKQSDIRRKFKGYLSTLDSNRTYDDISRFFFKNGSYQSIWDMVLPQLRPYDNDIATKQIVDELRELIRSLLNTVKERGDSADVSIDDSSHCRANHCRTIMLRTEEAILIVYLACLNKQDREALIFHPQHQPTTTDRARLQLLAEAELVQYAIDSSDQFPPINPSAVNNRDIEAET